MNCVRPHALQDLSHAAFAARIAQDRPVIVLPLGSQEEQGPNAPMGDFVAAEYEGALKVTKVDVDAEQELAGAFGVSSIPTIAFFEPGEQPKAVVGALPKEMLESAFELDRFADAG